MNNITINGLKDGISILENDNEMKLPAHQSDILYNDQEPFDLNVNEIYADGEYVTPYYHIEDFGETATLLCTISMEEAILGTTKTI